MSVPAADPTVFALELPPSWCALDLTHPQWNSGLDEVLAQVVAHPALAPFAAAIGEALRARARLLVDAGAAWMLLFRPGAAEAPTVIGGIVSRPGTSGGMAGLRAALTSAGWSCRDVAIFVTPGLRAAVISASRGWEQRR